MYIIFKPPSLGSDNCYEQTEPKHQLASCPSESASRLRARVQHSDSNQRLNDCKRIFKSGTDTLRAHCEHAVFVRC